MADVMQTDDASTEWTVPDMLAGRAKDAVKTDGFQGQIYKAVSVQRPVVVEYLKSLRRDRPNATVTEILRELDRRYVSTVTVASTGVGASAAIPAAGIPIALGLGVADLLFFYETSALYVLAVAELHGVEVGDVARAQPLVFGILLGEKSQSQVANLVLGAIPVAAGANQARVAAAGVVGKALPEGWGQVLTQQLPDSALAPVLTVLARQALKESGKLGMHALGKAAPFGVGAVIGGVGSFTFGRDVVKAARVAFPEPPADFPVSLAEFRRPEQGAAEPSRAVAALQAAARATEVFRSVDIDGDGIPDEARALTAVKGAGSAIKGAAAGAADAVGSVFRRKRGSAQAVVAPEEPTEDLPES